MREKSKVIEIPDTATESQMQTSLDTYLNDGWRLVNIFQLGTKTFAVLVKNIVR